MYCTLIIVLYTDNADEHLMFIRYIFIQYRSECCVLAHCALKIIRGENMKKYFKTSIFLLLAAVFLSVACKTNVGNGQQSAVDETVKYKVTFVVEGGEEAAPAAQSVIKDGKVKKPDTDPTPADTDKMFKHWSTEKSGETAYNFDTPVTADLKLYAVWGIKVTLILGNGSNPVFIAAAKDKKLSVPSNAKKNGALFKYWSEQQNGTDAYDFNKTVTAPFILYAVYYEIPAGQKRIYDIQGSSHTSPEKNQAVSTVPGIITGIHYSKQKADGFYMQDQDGDNNPVTSDGIYVYCGAAQFPAGLKVKDAVTVTGTVAEYGFSGELTKTQIKVTAKANVKILSSGNTLPEAVEIKADKLEKEVYKDELNALDPENEAIDYYESLEGMRVKVANPKVIAASYKDTQYIAPAAANGFTPRGGLMYNSYNSTGRVCVYPYACFATEADAHVANPEPTIGDSYTGDIIGVLGYSYGNYQIEITEALPTLTRGNMTAEESSINFKADKLNIVSYNLENFSFASKTQNYNKKKDVWEAPVFGQSSQKESEQRAAEFADHFINKLKAPDIICLIEIQDDNSGGPDTTEVSAKKTLKLLTDKIAAISGAPTYKSVNIDPQQSTDPKSSVDGGAPGANIRCCYLYRDDRIELVQDSDDNLTNSNFNTAAAIEADGSKLTQNPARIGVGDPSFDSCRKSLVAHFKFKGSLNGGKDFFVINNHLTSKRGDGKIWGAQPVNRASEVNRHKQADAITAFINSVKAKHSDARIISVGDYNDFWFSETIKKLKDVGMTNAIEKLSENERYTYVFDGHSQTLDNILVTNNITIDSADVLHLNSEFSPNVRLSDHDPVFVQLSW